ncbi:probable glutamate receptor [Cherax quadricarinatus]|uniref:probable glutamate receptor n=1 Tax=Cherax quadricarinatus TaxID=27406 RepID=UPI00387E4467
MISSLLTRHLAGCYKIVLYTPEEPYLGLVDAVVSSLGDATILWQMDSFLLTSPPYTVLTATHHHADTFCVAFVILARLQRIAEIIAVVDEGVGGVTAGSPLPGICDIYPSLKSLKATNEGMDRRKDILRIAGSRTDAFVLYTAPFSTSMHTVLTRLLTACAILRKSRSATNRQKYNSQRPSSTKVDLLVALGEECPKEHTSGGNTRQVIHKDLRVYHLVSSFPYSNGGPQVALVDVWVPGEGQVWNNSLYTDKFKNFHGHTFTIVTMDYAPFTFYEVNKKGVVHLKECVDDFMLRAMSSVLNFTYSIREPPDGQWGLRLENGSHTGVIGELEKYKADFSLNIAIIGEREEVVDYTIGYFNDPLTFCTSKPRPLNQALALIRPFKPLPVDTANKINDFLTIGSNLASKIPITNARANDYLDGNLTASFYLAPPEPTEVTMIINSRKNKSENGCHWSVRNVPRVLVATWIIVSLVILTSYVAMLIASFTLPKLTPTLNSLEDLVQSDLAWGIQDHEAADYQLLKTSDVPLYQKLYKGLKVCPSLDECLVRARDTKYAFITWRLYVEDRIAIRFTSVTGERKLHIATNDFFPSDIGWALSAGCPYRSKFNQQIRRLLEAGLISKWISQIIKNPKRREEVDNKEMPTLEGPQPITLAQLAGAFYILDIGNILALLLFWVEIFKK